MLFGISSRFSIDEDYRQFLIGHALLPSLFFI